LEDKEALCDRLEDDDLLKVMLKVLGDQRKYDSSFLTSNSQAAFVKSNLTGQCRIKFEKEFAASPPELVALLEMTL